MPVGVGRPRYSKAANRGPADHVLYRRALYEFSNQHFHRVENRSDQNRVHLIFDYLEKDTPHLFKDKHSRSAPVSWTTSYNSDTGEIYRGEA
jgi:hypothetical protein